MANIYKTAMGKSVDLDALRLANETAIAVGNMRVNARGDELGPGGKIVKTRAQVMADYHKLNAPVADDTPLSIDPAGIPTKKPSGKLKTPVAEDIPVAETISAAEQDNYVKPRGSFAEAVANQTEVKQELLDPAPLRGTTKSTGVSRI